MTIQSTRSYNELRHIQTYEERLKYLKLDGRVGADTFGFDRWINQRFYTSNAWKEARDVVIYRDNGCDLGIPGFEIFSNILIHHMNPVTADDITHNADWILDPEFLITTTKDTHNHIHFGVEKVGPPVVLARSPNDTRLW